MKFKFVLLFCGLIFYIIAVPVEYYCKTQFGIYDSGTFYSLVIFWN